MDGRRLKRSIIASAHRITEMQEQLNEINVFPVADADTGTNMASTMNAIIEKASACTETSLSGVCQCIAEGALEGARGNSGAILAQFFQGLAEACEDQERLSVDAFAAAVAQAVSRARAALANPREGTILTVMEDWAAHLSQQAPAERDYVALLQQGLQRARSSLADTPKKLKVLKKAGVVDAGAQGFVHLLEGLSDFIDSGKVAALRAGSHLSTRFKNFHFHKVQEDIRFRYCTECLLEGEGLSRTRLHSQLSGLGDSLIMVGNVRKLRLHIHTNEPQTVFRLAAQAGTVLQTKIEDMRRQNLTALQAEAASRRIALVTDSSCDLSEVLLQRWQVQVVPVLVLMGGKTFLDRVEISSREVYQILKANRQRITTSQPSAASFIKVYEALIGRFQSVISLHISGALSGTLNAAQTAARSLSQRIRIEVIDSKTTSAGLGLLVAEAGRLIEQGFKHDEIVARVNRAIELSRLYVCVPTLKYLMASGRLTKPAGLLAGLLQIKPIITLSREGQATEAAKVIGLKRLFAKTLELSVQFAERIAQPRIQIAHALAEERAGWFHQALHTRFPELKIPIVDASPALGLHAGIGSVAVAVMGEADNLEQEKTA